MQLFTIERVDHTENTYIFKATLEPSHKIFEGHFPQRPVVPGVCTMDMIKRCCAVIMSKEVRFDTIKEVKFLATILPSQHHELDVIIELKEEMNISVLVKSEDTTMMKLKATLI
ncbi:MAG: hypothetical protein SNH28_00315 [Rikenellaceae bacterium]